MSFVISNQLEIVQVSGLDSIKRRGRIGSWNNVCNQPKQGTILTKSGKIELQKLILQARVIGNASPSKWNSDMEAKLKETIDAGAANPSVTGANGWLHVIAADVSRNFGARKAAIFLLSLCAPDNPTPAIPRQLQPVAIPWDCIWQ